MSAKKKKKKLDENALDPENIISQIEEQQLNPLSGVVRLEITKCHPDFSMPWQNHPQSSVSGSGAIIEGHLILTNAHNVSDATFITVRKENCDLPVIAHVFAVDHECDLALLKVDDESFFEDTVALAIGETPEVRTPVIVAGFPMGGVGLSITEGVISRIEVQRYVHSGFFLLAAQLDAAINPGNSGGPVLYDGEIVGIAFQGISEGDGLGYMIPTPIIRHFLKDLDNGVVDGFGDIGIRFGFLENPDARRFLKMKKNQSGIRILAVAGHNIPKGKLQVNDVVLAIDGKTISNNGYVRMPNGEVLNFTVFIDNKQIGESIELTLLRNGKVLKENLCIEKTLFRIKSFQYDTRPNYYMVGGFVFTEMTLNFLMEFGQGDPPPELTEPLGKTREDPLEDILVSTYVLPDAVNLGYQDYFPHRLTAVDGKKVRNLRELIDAVEKSKNTYISFTFGEFDIVTLDRKKILQATPRIMERYRLPADRSDSLK